MVFGLVICGFTFLNKNKQNNEITLIDVIENEEMCVDDEIDLKLKIKDKVNEGNLEAFLVD